MRFGKYIYLGWWVRGDDSNVKAWGDDGRERRNGRRRQGYYGNIDGQQVRALANVGSSIVLYADKTGHYGSRSPNYVRNAVRVGTGYAASEYKYYT